MVIIIALYKVEEYFFFQHKKKFSIKTKKKKKKLNTFFPGIILCPVYANVMLAPSGPAMTQFVCFFFFIFSFCGIFANKKLKRCVWGVGRDPSNLKKI